MRVTSLIGNGMVLQRRKENPIWGYAKPGDRIYLEMESYNTNTIAAADGYFQMALPPMEAGGPYDIRLWDNQEKVTISDVLFGDVFLLGGQSNMELPISWIWDDVCDELSGVEEDQIRMFDVPKEYDFLEPRELLTEGMWVKACGKSLQDFSAAGFFAARELHRSEQVPIGLLQAAVGGTPVKAWCSEETIRRLGYDTEELDACKDTKKVQETITYELEREQNWWAEALHPFSQNSSGVESIPINNNGAESIPANSSGVEPLTEGKYRGKVSVPGFFEHGMETFSGSICLRKEIELKETYPKETDPEADGKIKFYFGAVIDADQTYINGTKIGETTFRYPPRLYEIPRGLLRPGKNVIEIHMLVLRAGGGLMPGKAYKIVFADGKEISLEGEWEFTTGKEMPVLPETTFFQYKASGLYNGMLCPLKRQKIRGCFFYQGESNVWCASRYEQEFTEMIADWRRLWQTPELPFVYVQLAGFSDGILPTEQTDWAYLREAQCRAEQQSENVRMIQAYDLGEYNDLHPTRKKEVGERIALAAQDVIYKKTDFEKGPLAKQFKWHEEYVTIQLETRQPLIVRSKDGKVWGFRIQEEDGTWMLAPACLLSRDTVRVEITQRTQAVSYAWNNCPFEANLYSESGMPVVPFQRRKNE